MGLSHTEEQISAMVQRCPNDTMDFDQFRRFLNLLEDDSPTLDHWRCIDHVSMATGAQYRGFRHGKYGTCVIVSANTYDPLVVRPNKVERPQPFSDLNPAKVQSDLYETFRRQELQRYGDQVPADESQDILALLDADPPGGAALEPQQSTWGCWDCLVQRHCAVLRGRKQEQMRCVFLTPHGATLFGRNARTVAVERGELELVDRVTAMLRLADRGVEIRNLGRLSGPCLYVESTGLGVPPVELGEVKHSAPRASGEARRTRKEAGGSE